MKDNVYVKIRVDSQEVAIVNPTISVKKQTGKHTCATLRGTVLAESYQTLDAITATSELQIGLEGVTEHLFHGPVTYLDMLNQTAGEGQYRELYLEAMSYTCLLDQKKEKLAYQKTSATYSELIDIVLSGYSNLKYLFGPRMSGEALDRFVVQYEETDWELLARLASQQQCPLVACHNTTGINFTVGVVWGEHAYTIPKAEENGIETVYDQNYYLRWNAEDAEAPVFEIGDAIVCKGKTCYVKEAEVTVEDHVLRQSCLLCEKEGFAVPEINNEYLTGLSLPGSVKDVRGNQLMVTLDIDASEETERWFVYSTFYSTFYCMPEKGDRINLYFPDSMEDHAFVLNSVRATPGEVNVGGSAGTAGSGGSSKTQESTQEGTDSENQEEVFDMTPYLDRLLNSEYAKLIDIGVTFGDDTESGQEQSVSSAETAGNAGIMGTAGINGSSRTGYDFDTLAGNNNIKLLCSRAGRMVILDDESGSISIVCDDGTYISLCDDGIIMTTEKNIFMDAARDIKLTAKNAVYLGADEGVTLNCQESCITITPDEIQMFGTDIKMNEE